MKRIPFHILVSILLLGTINSCEYVENPGPLPEIDYKSYIDEFIECDSLDVWIYGGVILDETNKIFGNVSNAKSPENIAISVDATKPAVKAPLLPVNIFYPVQASLINENNPRASYYLERQTGYNKYIKEAGDTTYNRTLLMGSKDRIIVTASPLKYVVITTDKDFDEYFPAGTDLSPLFHIIFDDVYASIKNNYQHVAGTYKSYFERTSPSLVNNPHSLRYLKLAETKLEDYPFTKAAWTLLLDAKPQKTDTYKFHIKITFANGKVLEEDTLAVTVKGKD